MSQGTWNTLAGLLPLSPDPLTIGPIAWDPALNAIGCFFPLGHHLAGLVVAVGLRTADNPIRAGSQRRSPAGSDWLPQRPVLTGRVVGLPFVDRPDTSRSCRGTFSREMARM